MIPSKNNPVPVYYYLHEGGVTVNCPAHIAIAMTLEGLGKLSDLAKNGDLIALNGLHEIGCDIVQKLNSDYFSYSASVLKWPVVLPQDRKARNLVTKHANEMRIGSVKAGAAGAAEKLSENSNKGFALKNLCRIAEARHLLKMSGYDGQEHKTRGEDGFFTGWYADDEFMKVVFHGGTEIDITDVSLLMEIRCLEDYCLETRSEWVRVIGKMLEAHPHMIPDVIKARGKTNEPATLKARAKTKCRGFDSTVKKALNKGLENVHAVPGKFGHFIGD